MPHLTVLPCLQPFLRSFAPLFTQPQQRHLARYLQGLLCLDGRRTLAHMSRAFLDGPQVSAWDRFVTVAPWELGPLEARWQQVLRREVRRLKPAGLRIAGRQTDYLLADDTSHSRTGPFLEGAGFHYNHTLGKVDWSHCLVTFAYRTGDYTLAYGCRLYVRQAEVAALNKQRQDRNLLLDPNDRRALRDFRSKVELVLEQLAAFRPVQPGRQVFFLFDSWYLCQQIVRAARAKNLDWCSMSKANRKVTLLNLALETGEIQAEVTLTVGELLAQMHPSRVAQLQFALGAVGQACQEVRVAGQRYQGVTYHARLKGIGPVLLVVVRQHWQKGWSPWVALVTNRLDLTVAEVVTVYRERWAEEVLHRDLKQQLGLTHCQMENLEGTETHYVFCCLAHLCLMLLRLQAERGELRTPQGQPVATVGRTVGEVRAWVKGEALRELVHWVYQQATAATSYEEVIGRLGMVA